MFSGGVFAGVAGLGIGFLVGWVWEQFHRRRRNKRLRAATTHDDPLAAPGVDMGANKVTPALDQPRLRLVPMDSTPNAHVVGSRLTSVRFSDKAVVFDFSGVVLVAEDPPAVSIGGERFCYPEAGSRDAFCRLIGATVSRMRITENNDVALTLDEGSELNLRTRFPPRP